MTEGDRENKKSMKKKGVEKMIAEKIQIKR